MVEFLPRSMVYWTKLRLRESFFLVLLPRAKNPRQISQKCIFGLVFFPWFLVTWTVTWLWHTPAPSLNTESESEREREEQSKWDWRSRVSWEVGEPSAINMWTNLLYTLSCFLLSLFLSLSVPHSWTQFRFTDPKNWLLNQPLGRTSLQQCERVAGRGSNFEYTYNVENVVFHVDALPQNHLEGFSLSLHPFCHFSIATPCPPP